MSPARRSHLAVILEVAVATLLLVVLCAPPSSASSKLPADFKRCRADDPDISGCLRLAVEDAFRKMKNGIASLGVLPVDPLKVDRIKINQGQGNVNINMDLRNMTIFGLAATRMTNYSADIASGILRTESLTPALRMEFNHVVSGRILLLPIRGAGPGSIVLNEVVTHHYLKSTPKTKKDGKTYWTLQQYKVKFVPKTISMDLKGLFGDEGRLGGQLNTFLNQNALTIFEEIGGAFEDAFGAVFKDITNRVFSKVPLNEIFIQPK
ncbi:protein takeout-like [Frankliniella occidentalis]|uniref:Protein takeout-like n=1 Tax=Frankliniella occidentalis TaxID=133901 RepID=A0A6J1SCQ0_FRAOC|nr:protein takeout-like [Frankliniella occidentalis]